jgi:hypothetical protein
VSLKLESSFRAGGTVIQPKVQAWAVFTANDPKSKLRMGFAGSSSSVSLIGPDPGRSRFLAGAGLKIQANDCIDISASYELETRKKYLSHYGSLSLGFSF